MNELIKHVNFNGDDLLAVKGDDGKIYAAVYHFCKSLFMSVGQMKNERVRIQGDAVLSKGGRKIILPTNGGNQEVLCLDIEYIPLWLAKINANVIEDTLQYKKLVSYQLKAKDILAQAFIERKFIVPATFAEALRLAADEYEARIAAESKLQIAAPKADSYDQFLSGDNFQDMNTVAKILHQGRNKLFALLRGKKILRSDNTPYQEYCDRGYFEVKQKMITMGDITFNKPQTYVTPKGFDYISKLVEKAECLEVMQ
jgi:phage antirepressor YoqD-like protein